MKRITIFENFETSETVLTDKQYDEFIKQLKIHGFVKTEAGYVNPEVDFLLITIEEFDINDDAEMEYLLDKIDWIK